MRRTAAVLPMLLLLWTGVAAAQTPAPAEAPSDVIAVSGTQSAKTFDSLWADYKRAADAGDEPERTRQLLAIGWLRIERNIRSLDNIALALVARAQDQIKKGNLDKAQQELRTAVSLDSHLPDAHFALAKLEIKRGPVGYVSAFDDVLAAMLARLPTARGRYPLVALVVLVGVFALFATAATFAVAMLVRHGGLLLHDIEESVGFGSRAAAFGVFAVFLFVPVMTLQGYGWLPFWWTALLFVYLSRIEQVLGALLIATTLVVAPATGMIEAYVLAQENPVLGAGLRTVEAGPDTRALVDLQAAVERFPEDKDLKYLLGLQYKKAGRYEDAASVYRQILSTNATDAIAQNNLANIEFAKGTTQGLNSALGYYQQATQQDASKAQMATLYYNMSLAHLQRFEYELSHAARTKADGYDRGLTSEYEGLWKGTTDRGATEATAVDLSLSPDEVWGKFIGTRDGVRVQNNAGRGGSIFEPVSASSLIMNRFTIFALVFAGLIWAVSQWRGSKAFTLRCQKCGTPFCRKCQLTAAVTGLCTQCHHLFVVRDGVSGPARNTKMLEVQREEGRRNKVFRVLSLLLPGAGQMYAQQPWLGFPLTLMWFTLIAFLLVGGRMVPVTEAPSALSSPWPVVLVAIPMLIVYVIANRVRPDFDYVIPMQQRTPRRMAAAKAS